MPIQAIKGSYFSCPSYGQVDYHEDALIELDDQGVIQAIVNQDDPAYPDRVDHYRSQQNLVELTADQYLLPGFIDTHIHAPQWPQAGIALDRPLTEWLDQHTFPLEAKYADLDFAKRVYNDLVDQLLAHGTTTALYFATIHKEASLALAKICAEKGQRGLVGKVVMDDPAGNPDYYRDASTDQALADTEDFILAVRDLAKDVPQGVYPVVTPRFAPSCTDEALAGLGELAAKYNCHVQSHCSEGQWEHDFTKERFGKTDTEALADFGLFGPKSVMAHSNFINDDDAKIFCDHQTAVAHCPISNVYFANSVIPIRHLKDLGVQIGLGSDISGGFSPSLYDNIKQAVMSSRQLEEGVDTRLDQDDRGVANSRIGLNEAFYLATAGGGEALDLPIGQIAPGFAGDLQVVSTSKLPNFDIFSEPEHILQRILYLSNKEDIKAVYCQGRLVHAKG
ncbi:guanine deaminase [Aerococcus urinaehominis]|uniref:Guanine deaminase n=1 Tax=Aerococcus urinaehominis TaxID=128944 RepID=A0A109RGX2_9LACT|nr:guanine deaminase [Aerococcus urinaehominis]AMB99985.1 guanine deaminase [Aerococcus urinaehominis]SDL82978.1 guanine deaminase [Aerococcus urinaehominis]